jgi:hypothetical protein
MLHYLTDMLYCVLELHTECYMADMANDNDTSRLLNEAAEKIRREGFNAGWRAAIAAVNKAATELVDPETLEDFEIHDAVTATNTVIAKAGDPTTGSTPWYVLQAVRKNPGMTGSEVVNTVQEGGHRVSEGSIRTALARMRGKHIVARHRKWFLA